MLRGNNLSISRLCKSFNSEWTTNESLLTTLHLYKHFPLTDDLIKSIAEAET